MIETIGLLAGIGGLIWYFWPKGVPHQSVTRQTSAGPITVAQPVSSFVNPQQANPGTYTPSSVPPKTALPIPNPKGVGAMYAPAPVIVKDSTNPDVLTLAPMVITPTGAASLSITTVQDVQNALNTLGYGKPNPLAIDGKVGPMTTAAIRAFQSAHGLTVDGLAGPNTKAALAQAIGALGGKDSTASTAPAVVNATAPVQPVMMASALSPTMSDLVARLSDGTASNKDVQAALNANGATPPLSVDGALGPKSVAAIKAFQLSQGLTVDGIAGPKTKAALAHVISGN